MKTILTFHEMHQRVAEGNRQLRIVAVNPTDEATREALRRVEEGRMAEVLRVTDSLPERAAEKAVALVRRGDANVLMKGLIGTDILLRALLNKVSGLLPEGRVLTHVSVAEIPNYPRLLFFTDAAVIPYPTQRQRVEQVRYTTGICHRMGIREPRIALIHCAEHGGRQFPFVEGYADIKAQAARGDFGRCIVDGPLDVKSACSLQALQAKGIISPLEGESDVLIMPDIEAGNAFYKSMTLFANARTAGMLCGTLCPVVVPSRGDSAEAKFNSILFALASL
ncbi:MAG: phosphate butyryltransferase [Prevotella sp.]|nr:phosphate butyryltransferase [Prevotella sp.]MBR1506341.1 phosphate butyryltransferase [Prevotella sp.]